MNRKALDVSPLPDYAFGHKRLIWWGTINFMVIEGSMMAMVVIAYFVLRTRSTEWPPGLPNPDVTWGTVNTLLLLVSLVPNFFAKKAAEQLDLRRVRLVMPIMAVFGVAFIVVRVFEFASLGTSWYSNAYGSIVWFIMGLHSAHVITDVLDTIVLMALIFTAHAQPRRMVDVSENSLYWNFIVFSWIPIYIVVYFGPRWL